MRSIQVFLEQFGDALKLSGSRRRRVLAEAHDHLVEARERGIRIGLEPAEAESAAIEAFGDPAYLASRFEPDLRTRTIGRLVGALDAVDCWRADHPYAGATALLAPLAVLLAVAWSPWLVLAGVPMWLAWVWLGRQLAARLEPGYRRRLWAWKRANPFTYDKLIGTAGALSVASWFALIQFAPVRAGFPELLWAAIPFYVLSWILNNPRPYKAPVSAS